MSLDGFEIDGRDMTAEQWIAENGASVGASVGAVQSAMEAGCRTSEAIQARVFPFGDAA